MTVIRRPPAISSREVALLVALGIALRVWWMVLVRAWAEPVDLGEATNAALALARRGVIGDVYFPGQGPTAHLLPTMIVIGAGIERAFGPDSAAANLALAAWALLQVSVGYVLTVLLFRRIGAGRGALLGGLGLLCAWPACVAQEAGDFRLWEGALAYDLAVANLLWMATLARRAAVRPRDLALAAAATALAFFVNPPAGLAAGAAWALFAVRRLTARQAARLAAMAALALVALVAPWALRNQAVLGETVLLRSNFGLELAIANHDDALDPASPRAALSARMAAVHQTRERYRRAGGEVAYSRQVGAQTWRWIGAHPLAFARLSIRHYRQFYVPDTWEERSTNWDGATRVRIVSLQVVGVLGLLGLAVGLARGLPRYRLIAAYVAVAGLPYAVVQPIPRYGYLVYPLLVFLAARLVADGLAALRRRIAVQPARPPGAAWAR